MRGLISSSHPTLKNGACQTPIWTPQSFPETVQGLRGAPAWSGSRLLGFPWALCWSPRAFDMEIQGQASIPSLSRRVTLQEGLWLNFTGLGMKHVEPLCWGRRGAGNILVRPRCVPRSEVGASLSATPNPSPQPHSRLTPVWHSLFQHLLSSRGWGHDQDAVPARCHSCNKPGRCAETSQNCGTRVWGYEGTRGNPAQRREAAKGFPE